MLTLVTHSKLHQSYIGTLNCLKKRIFSLNLRENAFISLSLFFLCGRFFFPCSTRGNRKKKKKKKGGKKRERERKRERAKLLPLPKLTTASGRDGADIDRHRRRGLKKNIDDIDRHRLRGNMFVRA